LGVCIGSVARKGQITIPKEIRETLRLREGDRVIFILEGERVVIRKVSGEKLSEILMKQKPWPESSMAFQKRLREEWGSK